VAIAVIIPPKITPEENKKRIRELEEVLSNIFKCEIRISFKDSRKEGSDVK
jgi:hypothetical protein